MSEVVHARGVHKYSGQTRGNMAASNCSMAALAPTASGFQRICGVVRLQHRQSRRAISKQKQVFCRAVTESRGPRTSPRRPIDLSGDALTHLKKLKEDSGGKDLLLRVGVKSGGCSGMSYTMDFEEGSNISGGDTVIEYDGFKLVTDSMSMMYLLGMTLDYSNKLIGGGFIFQNPNAQSECGCGKSFGV